MGEKTNKEWRELQIEILADIESMEFYEAIKAKHFAQGVPITYLDPADTDMLITEYPDGRLTKESMQEARQRQALANNQKHA